MFTTKRRLLEEKVAELEKLLSEERAAHESDNKELKELKNRMELQDRTFEEIRDALQKRLQEIEEKSRQYDIEEKAKRESLQNEINEKRKIAEQEIERYRAEQTAILKQRIQDFGNQYSLYFSKVYQASELLNHKALQIGNVFLEKDTNLSELFQTEMKDLLGTPATDKEKSKAVYIPDNEETQESAVPDNREPKEAIVSDNGEEKVNVVPFLLREDAPAKKRK